MSRQAEEIQLEGYRWKNEWRDEATKRDHGSDSANKSRTRRSGVVIAPNGTKTWTYDRVAYFREHPGSRQATLEHVKRIDAERTGRQIDNADAGRAFHCMHDPCFGQGAVFKRKADLERHIETRHLCRLIDCEYPECHRRGDYGFARKERMIEHMRNVHKVHPKATKTRENAATNDESEADSEDSDPSDYD